MFDILDLFDLFPNFEIIKILAEVSWWKLSNSGLQTTVCLNWIVNVQIPKKIFRFVLNFQLVKFDTNYK